MSFGIKSASELNETSCIAIVSYLSKNAAFLLLVIVSSIPWVYQKQAEEKKYSIQSKHGEASQTYYHLKLSMFA